MASVCRTTSLTYMGVLTFVETKLFTELVSDYFTDDEYAVLQNAIVANPEAGDVIRGSGGVRKTAVGRRRTWEAGRGSHHDCLVPAARPGLDADDGEERSRRASPGPVLKKIKEVLDGQD